MKENGTKKVRKRHEEWKQWCEKDRMKPEERKKIIRRKAETQKMIWRNLEGDTNNKWKWHIERQRKRHMHFWSNGFQFHE